MNGLNESNPVMSTYFESYADYDVHQLMLTDKVRTLAYKNAIFKSLDKFIDKVVMDVGAGTGILSVFCAKAGARKVYAVEASKIADMTKKVIAENNYKDIIEVIEKRVEDIDPNSIEKVDVIISEWMGFYLVHEAMLDSVIRARDLFLKEDGLIFPNVAKLYAAPCQLPSYFEFWDSVFGVSMKCVGEEFRQKKSLKLEILSDIKESNILTDEKMIAWIDLKTILPEELNVFGGEEYVVVCKKDGKYQGLCIWFTVEFPDGSELTTAPTAELTHWKQAAIVLPHDAEVSEKEPIAFKLHLQRDASVPRRYNVEMSILDATEVEHDIPCSCDLTKCIVTRTYFEQTSQNDNLLNH